MAGEKILIVEDNLMNRELVAITLTAVGYRVLEAEDGFGLLDRVKAERPALIIMDLQLPQIDGFTLTRELKNDAETRAIPILVTSAFSRREDRMQAVEAGCNEFLTKPLDMPLFLQTVAGLVSRVMS
ncbi:histidine kinase [Candidatus Methylomirabilis lanthanidiphila]|uniref:Histidine kinase n=1 Tax=Candidatus Methylomirabilis lanthanidiphila TaxID=2211376 RepID=A0A564ZJH9_9BACT|nr:response regulator [Candidatus Methylomirabilis lanthanidiphila]VUZ85027.1 histidine kinase [Candidatus Methylomirabilis lanthanidiphila]